MSDCDFVLQTFALSRAGAIRKLENTAHNKFKATIEKVRKSELADFFLSAKLEIVSVKRTFFKYKIYYLISLHCGTKACGTVTKYKKPTKKTIAETPKKVYTKRDAKGRFTK